MGTKKIIYLLFTILSCLFILTACENSIIAITDTTSVTDNNRLIEANDLIRRADAKREKLIAETDYLAKGYFYDEAIAKLKEDINLGNEQIEIKIEEYQTAKASLTEYTGQVFHVFFHSLIVYPELCFTGDKMSNGYNMWMTTKDEFIKMLPLLEQAGYVLYNIEDLCQIDSSGLLIPQKIMLPEGKKPLVISIDDVNYYDYMKDDGFASRMTVNEAGDVVTVVKAPDGTISETYDGDVVPILDQYVKDHPEFSYRGAKGIVAVTGYQGVFGYRITDLQDENLEKAIKDATKVAETLKNDGWLIANHSYTHNSYFNNGNLTMEKLKSDLDRWEKYIAPVTGKTNIFISPFGVSFKKDNPFFRYIVEQGYNIYCPVGSRMTTIYNEDNIVQERLNLDGYTMIKHPERVEKCFFDPSLVIDTKRPPLK